jgi:chorismate mutase
VLQQSEDQKQMFLDFGDRIETEAEMIARMNRQNKEAVKRLKEKKEKDLADKLKDYDGDPDAMAMGGRIGMSKGGGIINFIKSLLKKKKSPSESFQDYLKKMREESDRMNKEFYKGLEEGGELDQNVAKIKQGYTFPDRDQIKKQIKERMDKKKLERFDVEGRKPNAMGGRIGMSKGGGLIDLLKFFSKKSPFQAYKDYLASVKRRAQIEPEKLAPELGAVTAGGIFTNRKMKDILEEGNEQQKEKFLQEFIADLDKDPFYIDRPELKDKAIEQYTETLFGEKKAYGGRIGFDEGGPSNKGRRNFLKLMGGLASIPVVGKLFKPAAKVTEAAPVVAEGVKLGFDKFLLLVDKIKRLGRKTDGVTQKEREVGYTYKGKDGSEYELVEDIGTGDVRITKDKPGFAMSGDEAFDTIEDRTTFVFKKGETIVDSKKKKTVKTPDEYDEMKEVPSRDGTFDDIDEVDDNTVKEILKEIEDVPVKKSGGGLAYMLGE